MRFGAVSAGEYVSQSDDAALIAESRNHANRLATGSQDERRAGALIHDLADALERRSQAEAVGEDEIAESAWIYDAADAVEEAMGEGLFIASKGEGWRGSVGIAAAAVKAYRAALAARRTVAGETGNG